MILAGDIGGTKGNVALFRQEGAGLRLVFRRRFATREYAGFDALIEDFLHHAASEETVKPMEIDAAAFGVAGVVTDGRHYSENLPWLVDVSPLKQTLRLKNIVLLNDLAATALSLERLPPSDLVSLNPGVPEPNGPRGVIAAGTGLGEALLFWDGSKYRVSGAEGGQADFAPRTARQTELLRHLQTELGHVSCEEIVSGRGFRRIHEFLDPSGHHESFDGASANAAGDITQRGLAKSCPVCVETLDFWTEIFAGAAGNFALHTMTLGGIYIAGGVPMKILPKLQDPAFFKSFCGSGKLAQLVARIPLSVVTNEDAPMLGAAYQASNFDL